MNRRNYEGEGEYDDDQDYISGVRRDVTSFMVYLKYYKPGWFLLSKVMT